MSRTTLIERTYLCTFVWGKFFQLLAKWCTKFIFVYAKWIYYSATRRTIFIDNIIIIIFLPSFHSLLCSCVYVVHLLFAFHCMLVSGSWNKFTILLWKHTIWLEWKYIFCFDFTWLHSNFHFFFVLVEFACLFYVLALFLKQFFSIFCDLLA